MRFFFIDTSYGRGDELGRGRAVGVGRAVDEGVDVGVAVAVAVAVGMAVAVGVGVALGAAAQYLPPVFNSKKFSSLPPQTIISLPVQTAVL